MSYSRIKTWIAEILTFADLNAEFNGCIANENDLDTRLIAEIATRATLRTEFDALEVEYDALKAAYDLAMYAPGLHRAKFTWKDGDEIYIDPGAYYHAGTTSQAVYWDSQLTFQLQSGGSNADSDDYGADGWHYIYLDDSAIVTQGAALLDADCFLNDTTAPTWSNAKHGWYNGEDRCIFAVYETGGAIIEFNHVNDRVLYADERLAFANADPGTSFVDLDLTTTVPGFATEAIMNAQAVYVDGLCYNSWRTNGQTGSNGQRWAHTVGLADWSQSNTFIVITDSSQVIEHKNSASNNTEQWYTGGWLFPIGM